MSVLNSSTLRRPSDIISSSEGDNLTTCQLGRHHKSCRNNDRLRKSRDENVKMKKSVSFEEDVTVFLFDQESPTLRLSSESCTPLQNNFSCNLPAVTSENAELQWEDDFSVLEKSCCFQCVRLSHAFSLPTRSWTALPRPERSSLSQTFLFLTHVAESDLEL